MRRLITRNNKPFWPPGEKHWLRTPSARHDACSVRRLWIFYPRVDFALCSVKQMINSLDRTTKYPFFTLRFSFLCVLLSENQLTMQKKNISERFRKNLSFIRRLFNYRGKYLWKLFLKKSFIYIKWWAFIELKDRSDHWWFRSHSKPTPQVSYFFSGRP